MTSYAYALDMLPTLNAEKFVNPGIQLDFIFLSRRTKRNAKRNPLMKILSGQFNSDLAIASATKSVP